MYQKGQVGSANPTTVRCPCLGHHTNELSGVPTLPTPHHNVSCSIQLAGRSSAVLAIRWSHVSDGISSCHCLTLLLTHARLILLFLLVLSACSARDLPAQPAWTDALFKMYRVTNPTNLMSRPSQSSLILFQATNTKRELKLGYG